MMSDRRAIKFVRALINGGIATPTAAGHFRKVDGSKTTGLDKKSAMQLIADGVLLKCEGGCRASPLARNWLKRKMSGEGDLAAQHRHLIHGTDGALINLNESPLSRLAVSTNGTEPFLMPHQVESGERFRRLFERAHMIQRTTMSYDPNRVPGKSQRGGIGTDLSDLAIDARRELDEILQKLPRDCAGAVMDVCGFLKGLQTVEKERQWPRRSAKLVLRVGLEQLAQHFGLSSTATGLHWGRIQKWSDDGARPHKFE